MRTASLSFSLKFSGRRSANNRGSSAFRISTSACENNDGRMRNPSSRNCSRCASVSIMSSCAFRRKRPLWPEVEFGVVVVAVGCSLDVIFVLCGQRRWRRAFASCWDILRITRPLHTGLPVAANIICYSGRMYDADRRAYPLRHPDSRGQFSAPNNNDRFAGCERGPSHKCLQRPVRSQTMCGNK